MNNLPIGIFDSGVGGLTVARAILDQLPGEELLYVGDTAMSPYGDKPLAEVRSRALEITDHLVEQGVKMLVIACNSASAAMLRDARERYGQQLGIPVLEVIMPAARRALSATHNGKIGVIGTVATITSGVYEDALSVAPGTAVHSVACPELVGFVERGVTTGPELLAVTRKYLEPIQAAGVDTLVLGCTHYPLLTGALAYVMGPQVTLVSSAEQTAQDVYRELVSLELERDPSLPAPRHRFISTGEPTLFRELAHRFLGPEITTSKVVGDYDLGGQ